MAVNMCTTHPDPYTVEDSTGTHAHIRICPHSVTNTLSSSISYSSNMYTYTSPYKSTCTYIPSITQYMVNIQGCIQDSEKGGVNTIAITRRMRICYTTLARYCLRLQCAFLSGRCKNPCWLTVAPTIGHL